MALASFPLEAAPPTEEQIKEDAKQIIPDYDVNQKATPAHVALLRKCYQGADLTKLLKANGIEKLEDIPALKAGELLSKLAQKGKL